MRLNAAWPVPVLRRQSPGDRGPRIARPDHIGGRAENAEFRRVGQVLLPFRHHTGVLHFPDRLDAAGPRSGGDLAQRCNIGNVSLFGPQRAGSQTKTRACHAPAQSGFAAPGWALLALDMPRIFACRNAGKMLFHRDGRDRKAIANIWKILKRQIPLLKINHDFKNEKKYCRICADAVFYVFSLV